MPRLGQILRFTQDDKQNSSSTTVTPDSVNRAAICSVTPDSRYRESILALPFRQMDPRYQPAGLTGIICHVRQWLSGINL